MVYPEGDLGITSQNMQLIYLRVTLFRVSYKKKYFVSLLRSSTFPDLH